MRLALFLALALALVGCIHPADPVKPAATDPTPAPAQATPDPTPASAANATDPTPASPADNGTSPEAPAGGTTPAEAAPPATTPWNLSADAPLGYAAALADPAGATPRQTDATHCPDATLALPEGATKLAVAFGGDAGGPGGVGAYSLNVTSPAGKATTLAFDPQSAQPGAPIALEASFDAPAAGVWTFHADPSPAAAQSSWTLHVTAKGESAAPPAKLALVAAKSCS